jgi:hypothetical protein
MNSREYCLVSKYYPLFKKYGGVKNMCLTSNPLGPTLDPEHEARGWKWVPVSQVSQSELTKYRFWNERP